MNEKNYLVSKVNEVNYDSNRFKVSIGSDKYIFGIISGEASEMQFSELYKYKTVYDTIKDVDYKTKISFEKAIEFAYLEDLQNKFSIIEKGSYEETMAYYYIENALFRTYTLWELLAQLYRLCYQIVVDVDKVYHNKIFDPKSPTSDKFKEKAREINKYIEQEDNTDMEGEWEGNYKYVKKCRHKMTHRNSPNVSIISDYDMNFKQNPSYMLKRIIEDYNVVSKYISEILNIVEKEIIRDT